LALISLSCKSDIGTPQAGDISETLDSLEIKMNWLNHRLAQERWADATGGEADSLQFFESLRWATLSDESAFNTLRIGRGQLDDETDRRRFELVYPDVLHAFVNNSRNIRGIHDSLMSYYQRREYEFVGQMHPGDYLRYLVARSGSRSDRELAFRALNSPGQEVVSQVERLFRLRNQVAKRFGYNNYFALAESSQETGSSNYLQLISRVDSVSRPEYQQVLEDLRNDLRAGVVEIWDWRYNFADTWRALDGYFPADSQITFLKRSLAGLGFDLDNTPVYFHELGDSSAPSYAETIVMSIPYDIRVVCNLIDGFESMQKLMKATGAAVHAAETLEESNILGGTVDPAWSAGVARFFEDLCLQPEWLRTYARVPQNLVDRVTRAKRSNDLLGLRLMLTNAMFEYEAYRNPNTDLNRLWWDLFETYTMLPVNEDLQPWATKEEFVSTPLSYRDRLQAEIIANQTWAYLVEHYDALMENPEVRSFLVHNYFRFGGRYPWPELVERATGEEPSPDYLAGR
jgi:peptidyl-dipeptidase A